MLSNDSIVQVSVFASAGASSPTAYDTGLILAPKGTGTTISAPKTYTSASDMLTDGFTTADDAYKAVLKYFAASPTPTRVIVITYGSGTTPAAALDAAEESQTAFYGIFCCDQSAETIAALSTHILSMNGHYVYFYSITGSVEDAVSPSGIFAQQKNTASRRAFGIYTVSALDGAAVLGTAMGLALHNRSGAFALCYKQVSGIQPAPLTESQVSAIKALNANVYIARGYSRLMLENGTTASGLRYDEILYMDRIAGDLQDAAVALLADNAGKLAQTNETSAVFINRFSAILADYASAGVLATAIWRGTAVGRLQPGDVVENGYVLWADSYDAQSDADRAAHKAMPIHCALCLSGSVETLVLDINVTI